MTPTIDINTAIVSLVREAVGKALSPHLGALERLGAFLGATAKKAARPVAQWNTTVRARSARRPQPSKSPAARGDASKFKKGQKVAIAVGRGSDTGVVTAIELATGSVMVKRDKSGKVVKRPARGVRPL